MDTRFDSQTVLPRTGMTLEDARRKLSGLHFAKESLSDGERDILYVAEGLLRLIDSFDGPKGAPDEGLAQVRALLGKAGTHAVDVYDDGVEVVGAVGDSDASAGFVAGTFTVEQIWGVVDPSITVTDHRR